LREVFDGGVESGKELSRLFSRRIEAEVDVHGGEVWEGEKALGVV
jgi:hypothetical protein